MGRPSVQLLQDASPGFWPRQGRGYRKKNCPRIYADCSTSPDGRRRRSLGRGFANVPRRRESGYFSLVEQRSYLVAVMRDGVEHLEGQMVRAATAAAPKVGDQVNWSLPAVGDGPPPWVLHEVIEVRDATEHFESVVVLQAL